MRHKVNQPRLDRALAARWQCDVSTIWRWRASGAPLDAPGWRGMDRWLAGRDHVGKGTLSALRAMQQADPKWQRERQEHTSNLRAALEAGRQSKPEPVRQPVESAAEYAAKALADWHQRHDAEVAADWRSYFNAHRQRFATEAAWQEWRQATLDAAPEWIAHLFSTHAKPEAGVETTNNPAE
jgi:hypothetical protein